MPRRRFHELPRQKRAAILGAAAAEFSEHGFEPASQNRIIARAGISKGALYYYVDDKRDLYVTVVKDSLTRVIEAVGPFPDVPTPERFWAALEAMYARAMQVYRDEPYAAGLVRSLAAATGNEASPAALRELESIMWAWTRDIARIGQEIGSVRTDLPETLLLRVLLSLTEAMDLWCAERIESMGDDEAQALAAPLVALIRRIAEPRAADAHFRELLTEVDRRSS